VFGELCRCAYAVIKAKVPFDEFADYDAKVLKNPSANPPPRIVAALRPCV
jgi:hypothetical protein